MEQIINRSLMMDIEAQIRRVKARYTGTRFEIMVWKAAAAGLPTEILGCPVTTFEDRTTGEALADVPREFGVVFLVPVKGSHESRSRNGNDFRTQTAS